MSPGPPAEDVGTLAARLAERLPEDDLERLATGVLDGVVGVQHVKATATSSAARGACDQLAKMLEHGANGTLIAGALLGARRAVERQRTRSSLDVVWTGPSSGVTTSRLTSAVVIELIDAAQNELILVSYATHPPTELTAALSRAVARKVDVTVLLERSQDNPHFTGGSTAFACLAVRRLAWPAARRPDGASLHAKILVVDGHTTLIGSANLTGYALERNLECGVLLKDRAAAQRVRDHLLDLRSQGHLEMV